MNIQDSTRIRVSTGKSPSQAAGGSGRWLCLTHCQLDPIVWRPLVDRPIWNELAAGAGWVDSGRLREAKGCGYVMPQVALAHLASDDQASSFLRLPSSGSSGQTFLSTRPQWKPNGKMAVLWALVC